MDNGTSIYRLQAHSIEHQCSRRWGLVRRIFERTNSGCGCTGSVRGDWSAGATWEKGRGGTKWIKLIASVFELVVVRRSVVERRALLIVAFLLLSCALGFGGGQVNSTIYLHSTQTTPATISLCHDVLDVKLTIDNLGSVDRVEFSGMPVGATIGIGSVTGNFSTSVSVNGAQIQTVTITGTGTGPQSGSVTFTVSFSGCELFNHQLQSLVFTTTYANGMVINPSVTIGLVEPTIGITQPDSTLPTYHCEYLLMNDVVRRYYKIKAHASRVDAFRLSITPQPGIEIQSINVVGPDAAAPAVKKVLLSTPTTSPIQRDFGGSTGIAIGECSFLGSGHTSLENADSTGDYILIEETIKIIGCTATPEAPAVDCNQPSSASLYTVGIHCESDFSGTPCWKRDFSLNVNSVERPILSLGVALSDRADGYHPGDFSQSGGISFCENADGVDYTFYVLNNKGTSPANPPAGAGSLLLKTIKLPINRKYFTFDELWVGGLRIDGGNVDDQTAILYHVDEGNPNSELRDYIIDFTKITQDPSDNSDPDMQLLNKFSNSTGDHLKTGGRFNLLPEGKHVKIILKNFRFTGNENFELCPKDAPAYSLGGKMLVFFRSMCDFNTPDPQTPLTVGSYNYFNHTEPTVRPAVGIENSWAFTRFRGYSYALSDATDIAPGNSSGQPQSANLTYTFLRTQSGFADNNDGPMQLKQRVNGIEVMKCPTPQYRAVIKLPPGFSIGNGGVVTVARPLDNSVAAAPVTAILIGSSTDGTEWAVPYDGGTYSLQQMLDHNGGYVAHPSQITLSFKLLLDCAQNGGKLFGEVEIPVEFQASCETCNPEVYRTFSCAQTEIYYHCQGPCSGPTVGTANFVLDRITPGWTSQAAFRADPQHPNATIDPAYSNRVYQFDVVRAISTEGVASHVAANGTIAFEIAYEPPAANGNLLYLIPGTGKFTFHNANQAFTIDALPAADFLPADANHPRPMLRVYANVSTQVEFPMNSGIIKSARQWLNEGDYTAEFQADFRVQDPTPLAPDFYIIPQLRGQFIVVNANHDPAQIDQSCDPWGDNLIFLKTKARVEVNALLGPGGWEPSLDECFLRYVVKTRVDGQFPVHDNFPTEYRPTVEYPDHIRFDIPPGYVFASLGYRKGPDSLAPATMISMQDVTHTTAGGNGGFVEVNGLHTKYPDSWSVDTINQSLQAFELILLRVCPRRDDNEVTVLSLDITTNAYCVDAALRGHLMPAQPQKLAYGGSEPYQINLQTVNSIIGNINPVTVPVTLSHSGDYGAGLGLLNTWAYFTVDPGSAPVTSLTVRNLSGQILTPTAAGLYELGELLNISPIKLSLDVGFQCQSMDSAHPEVFKPVKVNIHYGNNCTGYPVLQANQGAPPNAPYRTDEVDFQADPCLMLNHLVTILPQSSTLLLSVDPPQVTDCRTVTFHVRAGSSAADVQNALFKVVPPAGFILDPAASKVETALMTSSPNLTPSGNTWQVTGTSGILDYFNHQTSFNVDSCFTLNPPSPCNNNIIDFTLVYTRNCPAGQYTFDFDLSGVSSCVINKSAGASVNVDFSASSPSIVCGAIASTYATIADAETAAIAATTASSPCGGAITKAASTTGTCDITVTVTAVDACGRQNDCVYLTKVECAATNCCDNCTNYVRYTNTVETGYNYLAMNLCPGTNDSANELLGSVPDFTELLKWNVAMQAYQVYYFDSTLPGWMDGIGTPVNVRLALGEGFVLNNPGAPFELVLRGCEPTNCPLPCLPTNGCVLVGRYGLGLATWTNLSSCPPRCVTHVYLYNGSGFEDYSWNGTWTPGEPAVPVGRSVFVCHTDSTNCCTNTLNAVANGSFELTVPPMNASSSKLLNANGGLPGWTTSESAFEVWCNLLSGIPASQGTNQLELNAQSSDQTVLQTVSNLNTNCATTLCFDYTGGSEPIGGAPNNEFTVTLSGGFSMTVPLNPLAYASGGWLKFCTNFMPTAPSITLAFRGQLHGENSIGAHIDNVSLIQCCPPSSPCSRPAPKGAIALSGGNVVISWNAVDYRLEGTSIIANPASATVWTPIPGTSPIVHAPSNWYQFFRLVCP